MSWMFQSAAGAFFSGREESNMDTQDRQDENYNLLKSLFIHVNNRHKKHKNTLNPSCDLCAC